MMIAHMLAAALWTCSVPLLPDYKPKTNTADVGEGVTYLYVGDRHLRTDYGADAVFTTPLDGRRGWYDSAIHFGAFGNEDVFAQIEISRWARFDYRPHVAIAWALPHSTVVEYRDTSLFLTTDAHIRSVSTFAPGRCACSSTTGRFAQRPPRDLSNHPNGNTFRSAPRRASPETIAARLFRNCG
jgi:hypothetical protein